jgi:ethanolamine permease
MQVRPAIQRKGGSRLAGAVSRLDIVCMGSVIVWAGFYNSWNVAFAAGFGTCLIAFVLVGAAYYYLCGCLSTISSVIPFSGGAYGLARGSLGFYPGFVVGCCEAIQYMIFVTVCSIYAAQYTCALFPAATQVRALIWALVVGSSILIHAVCSKRCVYRILVGIAIVDLLALVVFCLGSLKFANFYDNALVVRDIPATAATVSGRQYYVDSNSCDSFSVASRREWFIDGFSGFLHILPYPAAVFLGIEALNMASNETINPKRDVPQAQMAIMPILLVFSIAVVVLVGSVAPGAQCASFSIAPLNPALLLITDGNRALVWLLTFPSLYGTTLHLCGLTAK